MRHQLNRRRLSGLVVTGLVISASVAAACSVPVFRYALERWSSDNYQIIIFHDGKLTDEQQAIVDDLGGDNDQLTANVEVHSIDATMIDPEKEPDLFKLWQDEKTETLPRMVAYYPPQSLARGSIWSGAPTKEAVSRLLDSPVRREAARRILKGETAVWVFVEGGDKKLDDEKFQVLEKNLRKAEKTLKLPEIEEQDIADGLVTIDPDQLKIQFSAIRLSRDDSQEEMFVQMLLRSEEGLQDEEFAGKPMVFPLFGRCRALYALVGDGIVEGTVLEACAFLIGPCTCQVKAQNEHGTDMLTSVDWDGLIEPAVEIDKELPPLSGLGAFASIKTSGNGDSGIENKPAVATGGSLGTHAESSSGDGSSPNVVESSSSVVTTTLIVVGLGMIGVIFGSVLLTRKST